MGLSITENLKTRYLNINEKKRFHAPISINNLKKSPFIYYAHLDFSNFVHFKKFFAITGDLYLRGLLSYIEYAILPFSEEEFEEIRASHESDLTGYLFANVDKHLSIPEDNIPEYDYLLERFNIFYEYKEENQLEKFKEIKSAIVEEINKLTRSNINNFDEIKLRKLHDFIFNNDFKNPHSLEPKDKIKFKDIFNNLKDLINNSIIIFKYLNKEEKISEINFIPVKTDYFLNNIEGDDEFKMENIEELFKKYISKIMIDIDLKNMQKPIYYNYADLNLDTLFFLEIIQNYIDNMKIGTCTNCNDFFILSNKQDRWENAYCSNDCRIKYKNYISNKNKKEKLLKDKKYRTNTNEYMRNYMRDYRKSSKK